MLNIYSYTSVINHFKAIIGRKIIVFKARNKLQIPNTFVNIT